jgi:hypothetical protein
MIINSFYDTYQDLVFDLDVLSAQVFPFHSKLEVNG